MGSIKAAILINAYWLTYPLIGYALLRLSLKIRKTPDRIREAAQTVLRQHPLVIALCSFALSVFLIGVVTVLGYLFTFPVAVVSGWYVLLLVTAILFAARQLWRGLFSTDAIDLFGLRGQPLIAKLAFIGLGLFVIIDFVSALAARSHAALGSDTYVHLSRIVAILHQGLTIDSGFFHTVPEVGYHMNITYALYAIPAQLFHLTASTVWEFSFGFLRLMQWLAIFALAWHACTYWLRDRTHALLGASLSTMFAIAYFSTAFFIAVYPNEIVNIWMILFVIVFSHFEGHKKMVLWPLAALAFLITFTHPTYAMITGFFVALVVVLRLLVQRKSLKGRELRETILAYALPIFILCFGPLRSVLFPNHLTETGTGILKYKTWDFGFLTMKQPHFPYNGKIPTILMLLGIFGTFFLIYKLWRRKQQWAIVFALVMFYPLMVYIPFTYTVLQAVLPVWIIDRFTAMNVLNFIGVPLGIYGVIMLTGAVLRKRFSLPKWVTTKKTATMVFSAIIVLLAAYYMASAPASITKYKTQNDHYYDFMNRTYDDFHDFLTDDKVVVAHRGDSYLLASVLPIDVVAIEETHTTPAADAKDRAACLKQLMIGLNYQDLKSVHASYVVLATYEPTFGRERMIAEHSPYLRFVKGNGDFYVYQFVENKGVSTAAPFAACTQYQKEEK